MLIKEWIAWVKYIGKKFSCAWHLKNCIASCLGWWGGCYFYFYSGVATGSWKGHQSKCHMACQRWLQLLCTFVLAYSSLKYLNPLRDWSEECHHMTEFLFKLKCRKAFKINGSQVVTKEVVLKHNAQLWNRQQWSVRFWVLI